jgi:membrane associated rhomboid family serine protease
VTEPGAPPTPPPAPRVAPRLSLSQQVRRAPATFALIAFTSLVFLLQEAAFTAHGHDVVGELGAKVNAAILAGEVWRLITPVFLHGGLWHLCVNMYSLYALGPAVERLFGWRRMLTVYLLGGVAGVEFSLAFNSANSLGASGAIFGLLGALGVFLYQHRASLGRSGQIHFRQIVFVALLNLGLGLIPGIDDWAHIGGLTGGVGLAFLLGPRFLVTVLEDGRIQLRDQRPWNQIRGRVVLAAAGLLVLAAAAALISPSGA